jgi:hypothetical protein
MRFLIACIVTLLLPAVATACDQIGSRFQYCFDGTPWAAAEIESFGDGATYHLGALTLDQIEPYPGRSDGPAAEDLATYNDFFEIAEDAVFSTQEYDLDGKNGVIQVVEDADLQTLTARAIVVSGDARVLLWVTAPEGTEEATVLDHLNAAISALSLM